MQDQFAHICGRIRALEANPFNKDYADRMISAKNADEAFQILNETNFSDWMKESIKSEDFEKVIDYSMMQTKNFLVNTAPENWIVNIIWAWYDYYNIKTAIKANLIWENFENISWKLTPYWNIEFKKIKDAIFEWSSFEIERLNDLKNETFQSYEKNKNLQLIDIICDKHMYEYFIWKSKKLWSKLLTIFYKKKIDITNIISYLRTFKTKYKEEFFIKWWTLDKSVLIKWQEDEINQMINSKILSYESIDNIFTKEWYMHLSSIFEAQLSDLLNSTKQIVYSKEVVFAYFWRRMKESIAVRVVMVWKINSLPEEKIRNTVNKILI